MLSGFLLAHGIISGTSKELSFSAIIKRRIRRLYPVYVCGLVLPPIIFSVVWYEGNYIHWLLDGHLGSFFVELFMLQTTGVTGFQYINFPAWYVSALFIASIVEVFLVRHIKEGISILCAGMSILIYVIIWVFESPTMANNTFIFKVIPVPILRGIAGVLLGTALYYIWLNVSKRIENLSNICLSIVEVLALVGIFRLILFRESSWINGLILIPFAALILIMYSTNKGIVSRILSNKKWNYLSKISYSFYIMQSFCSNVFTCMCPNVKQPWVFMWYLLLNLIVAIIVHKLVEEKFVTYREMSK